MIRVLIFSLFLSFVNVFGSARIQDSAFGILYINDGAAYHTGVKADVEGLHRIVDSYADSGQKLLIYGVRSGLLTFNYQSRLPGEYFAEGYADAELEPVHRALRDLLKSYFDQGIDPFGEVVRRANQRGLKILAQIRPNNFNPTKSQVDRLVNGRFYYEHPEYRIEGHFNWDYGKPFVRNYMLDAIKEILERYDVDGLDIDFTQQPPYFHESEPKKVEVMNAFVRSVRAELDRVGRERNKEMLFTVAIRADVPKYHWRVANLDLPTWASEGIVDLIALYEPTEERRPIPYLEDLSEYFEAVEGTDCLLFVEIEGGGSYSGNSFLRGMAHEMGQEYFATRERTARAAGLDGVLYRNYVTYPANRRISHEHREYRSFNAHYYADSPPEEAAHIWTSNNKGVAAAFGGVLTLGGNREYTRDPAMLDVGSDAITVEAEVRIVSAQEYRDCFIEVANGRFRALLSLFEDKIRLWDVGLSHSAEVPLVLTEFHNLRLTLDGEGIARLYVDGSRNVSAELQLKNRDGSWRVNFGNGGRRARSLWRRIHYTLDGAFSPSRYSFPAKK